MYEPKLMFHQPPCNPVISVHFLTQHNACVIYRMHPGDVINKYKPGIKLNYSRGYANSSFQTTKTENTTESFHLAMSLGNNLSTHRA